MPPRTSAQRSIEPSTKRRGPGASVLSAAGRNENERMARDTVPGRDGDRPANELGCVQTGSTPRRGTIGAQRNAETPKEPAEIKRKRGRGTVAHGNPAKRWGTRPMTQTNRNADSDTKNEHEMNANQTIFTKKGFFHVQPQERFLNEFRESPPRAVERRRRSPSVSG